MSNIDTALLEAGDQEEPSAIAPNQRSAARLAVSYIALSLGTFGGQILGFVALTIVSRKIGPNNLGAYGFANGLSRYFSMPMIAGVVMLGIRDIATNPEQRPRTVVEVQALLLLNAILGYALLFFLAPTVSTSSQTQTLLRLLGLNLLIGGFSLDWAMQGLQRMRLLSVLRFVGQVVYLAVLLIVIVPGSRGATLYGVCNLIGACTTALLTVVYVWRIVCVSGRQITMGFATLIRRLAHRLRQGLAPGLGLLMVTIYFSVDILLLGYLRGNYAVGEYTAAGRIPGGLAVFSSLWITVFYPHAASLFHDNPGRLRRQVGEFTTFSLLAVLPSIPAGFLLGKPILVAVFGAKFGPGGAAFGWLVFAVGLGLINANLTQLLLACKNERGFLWSVASGAVANVVLNLLLIPVWGIDGSAIATVVAELTVIAVAVPKLTSLLGRVNLDWRRTVRAFPSAVATGALTATLLLFVPWWVALTAIAPAYLTLLVSSGAIAVDEVVQLFSSVRTTGDWKRA